MEIERDIDNSILFLQYLNRIIYENLSVIVLIIVLIEIALVIYVHFRTQVKSKEPSIEPMCLNCEGNASGNHRFRNY